LINHVRTLLLNRRREGHRLTEAGEEYIPAEYVPKTLTAALRLIHSSLFGGNPDRLFLNYRMRQIMQLIHATPLAGDLLVDDPRITYLPFKDDFFDGVFRTHVVQIAGTARQFDIIGEHVSNMGTGLSRQVWDVIVEADDEVTVVKRRGVVTTAVTSVVDDSPVELIGSGLRLFLHGAEEGTQLRIESFARPAFDVATVLSGTAAVLGQHGIDDIFPPIATGPVAVWKRIWNDHPDAMMKFAAMLLATAYRTAQMPQES
jgi:hypothetical protein